MVLQKDAETTKDEAYNQRTSVKEKVNEKNTYTKNQKKTAEGGNISSLTGPIDVKAPRKDSRTRTWRIEGGRGSLDTGSCLSKCYKEWEVFENRDNLRREWKEHREEY